jgi:hypothetical protein
VLHKFPLPPGVNFRITYRHHAAPVIQVHLVVHSEILCNSKVKLLKKINC